MSCRSPASPCPSKWGPGRRTPAHLRGRPRPSASPRRRDHRERAEPPLGRAGARRRAARHWSSPSSSLLGRRLLGGGLLLSHLLGAGLLRGGALRHGLLLDGRPLLDG